eukprot:6490097-Amphidinium_carterae.2
MHAQAKNIKKKTFKSAAACARGRMRTVLPSDDARDPELRITSQRPLRIMSVPRHASSSYHH